MKASFLSSAAPNRARLALAKEAARHDSWENVGKGVIAAAQGRLDALPTPPTNISRAS